MDSGCQHSARNPCDISDWTLHCALQGVLSVNANGYRLSRSTLDQLQKLQTQLQNPVLNKSKITYRLSSPLVAENVFFIFHILFYFISLLNNLQNLNATLTVFVMAIDVVAVVVLA